MSEHLRYLSQHARVPLSVMPNAGLPELTADGAVYPLTPDELADGAAPVRHRVRRAPGRRLLRHHARSTSARSSSAVATAGAGRAASRAPRRAVSSLYHHVPFAPGRRAC